MIEPIIKEITVAAAQSDAFEVFTAQFAFWWPLATHSLSANDGKLPKTVVLKPGIGGAIEEELFDGRKANWGSITEWDPSRKLAFTWHLHRLKNEQTHVSVEFIPVGDSTRIRLVHAGWDEIGKNAADSRAQYQTGWDVVLAGFVAIFAT